MGKTRIFLLLIGLLTNFTTFAQKHDYNWAMGEDSMLNLFSFENESLSIDSFESTARFWITNSTMSDSMGNLLFYTNGRKLYGANHQEILEGDSLGYGYQWEFWAASNDMNVRQGTLVLPVPDNSNHYKLFQLRGDTVVPPSQFPTNFLGINDLFDVSDIVISNVLGDVIVAYDHLYSSIISIDMHELSSGIYILKIGSKQGDVKTKILIKE